jgi:hypothetical protein
MKIEIITSFNESYYNLIGKDCVSSWLKHWPKELSLTCYVEGFTLPPTERIKQISFDNLCKEYFEFQKSNENDRVKIFSKKAYSAIHAFENSDADYIIWIDADVITGKTVPLQFIESLCNDKLAVYMQVYHYEPKGNETVSRMFISAETGFFIVNKKNKDFEKFVKRYREHYDKKLKDNIRRLYDGEVFGYVVNEVTDQNNLNDLCRESSKKHKSPLKHTVLGEYIVHYKSKGSKDSYSSS